MKKINKRYLIIFCLFLGVNLAFISGVLTDYLKFCNQEISHYDHGNFDKGTVNSFPSHSFQINENNSAFLSLNNESALVPYMNATADGLTPDTPILISNLNISLNNTNFSIGLVLANIHRYINIQNCIFREDKSFSKIGIFLQNCSFIQIRETQIIHAFYGLYMRNVSNIQVSNDTFQGCSQPISLYKSNSDRNSENITIRDNFIGGPYSKFESCVNLYFTNNIITPWYSNRFYNTFDFFNIQYLLFDENSMFLTTSIDGYIVNGFHFRYVNVTNFKITNSVFPGHPDEFILLRTSQIGDIANNTMIHRNYRGMKIYSCDQLNIHDNLIINKWKSSDPRFYFYRTKYERIFSIPADLEIEQTGIYFNNVSYSHIEKNKIYYYTCGISLINSNDNQISENQFNYNSFKAIYSDDFSVNQIHENKVRELILLNIPLLFLFFEMIFLVTGQILYQKMVQKPEKKKEDKIESESSNSTNFLNKSIERLYNFSYSRLMFGYNVVLSLIVIFLGSRYWLTISYMFTYIIIYNISFIFHVWTQRLFRSLIFEYKFLSQNQKTGLNVHPIKLSTHELIVLERLFFIEMTTGIGFIIAKLIEFGLLNISTPFAMKELYMEYLAPFFFHLPLIFSGFWVFQEGTLAKSWKNRFKSFFHKRFTKSLSIHK